jgi:hypothetical protein
MNPDVRSMRDATARPFSRRGPDKSFHRRKEMAATSHADTNPPQNPTRYLASLPIMVLAFRDNHHAAVTISAGEVFEVIGPAPDDRFTVVKVAGEELLVFESDLKQRGKLIYKEQAQSA